MADLSLIIDTSSVDKALSKTTAFERQIKNLVRRFSDGSASSETYNKGLLQIKRNYEQLGVSSQKATYEVRKFAQSQRDAMLQKDADIKAQEVERLRKTYNETYLAANLFKTTLGDLNNALKVGAISTAQHTQKVAELKNEYRQFLSGNVTGFNRFTTATTRSTRGINTFGLLAQQSGYQIGDFLVQVQSGTNFMVAFGQQATQVAGTLTLLGGKWLFIGSALGIVIPLLTAVGALWLRTREESKKATDSMEEAINNLIEKTKELKLENESLLAGFENTDKFLADQKRLELIEQIWAVEKEINRVTEERKSGYVRKRQVLRQILEDLQEELALHSKNISALEEEEEVSRLINKQFDFFVESLSLAVDRGEDLSQGLDQAAVNALRLAGVDMSTPISDAARQAAILAGNLGIALNAALSLSYQRDFKDTLQYSGRGAGYEYREQVGLPGPSTLGPSGIQSMINSATRTGGGGSGGGGGGGPSLQEQLAEDLEQLKRQLDEVYDRSQKFKESQELLNNALSSGLLTQQEYSYWLEKLKEEYGEVTQAVKDFRDMQQQVADTLEGSFTSAIEAITQSGNDLGENLKKITLQMINDLYRVMFVQRMVGSFDASTGKGTGLVGLITPLFNGLLPNANGNVFHSGMVKPFANGGIVNSPTLFPMANGAGLMGEAGPEAIMPLTRGKDGKLGVKTEGQSRPVNVTINISTPDVKGFQKSQAQIGAQIQRLISSSSRNL